MRAGIYIGEEPLLKGQRALLTATDSKGILGAQFDSYSTGKALGWHPFAETDFVIEEPVDWDD